MNSTVIKKVAYVASGAICGALGAYFVTNKVVSDKYEEIIKEIEGSVEENRKALQNRVNKLTEQINIYEQAGLSYETAMVIASKNQKAVAETSEQIASDIDIANKKRAEEIAEANGYINYSKISEGSDLDDSEVQEQPKVENFTQRTTEYVEDPYVISVDDFSENHEEYKKVSATYYTEDQVLCESSHNEIIDLRHVGADLLADYDGDLLYVRNDYLGVDYEIDIYHSSYTYEVLGEDQLDEE